MNIKKLWDNLFLVERPSIGLSFFRIFVALTVGLHVIPSFLHLDDNYLSTAFKEYNPSFFPLPVLALIQQSPDGLVVFFVYFFLVTWFFFLAGLFSQVSCILMTAACYYFYALNSFHIGTLSWDILLVTLFLMCITNYHGDYFSVDCLRHRDREAYRRKQPVFVQRLLQMQIASTYFYTALYKVSASGNWLRDNPLYYLWNYPPEGVTKAFLFRGFWASHPDWCYVSSLVIVVWEFCMPLLLFWPVTRTIGIVTGFIFQTLLVITLHVPTIFFFLFPPQLLLFINPDHVLAWVEKKRARHEFRGQALLVYDGKCRFCIASIQRLKIMDMFEYFKEIDYHQTEDIKSLHPQLTKEICHSQLHLVEPGVKLSGGFFIFRRLSLKAPMLYPFIPLLFFPGSGLIGPAIYRWVAKNRTLFHASKTCRDNACFAGH